MQEQILDSAPLICLFGPVRVVRPDGSAVRLGGSRQRALLTTLALNAARNVSVDALVEAIWGERTPPSVVNALQVHVSTLRTSLAPLGVTITRHAGSYQLDCSAGHVDAGQVALLHARALELSDRGEAMAALAALERADEIGAEPLAFGIHATPALAAALAIVEEEVRAVRLSLVRALCASGGAERAVPLAHALTAQLPFDESVWSALITAQYHAGRTADALASFRKVRRLFVEELGVEPSPKLSALQASILNHDLPVAPARPVAEAASVLRRFESLAALAHARGGTEDGRIATSAALALSQTQEFDVACGAATDSERSQLADIVMDLEELTVEHLEAMGRLSEAREQMARLVTTEPSRERRVRQQMRLLYRCGLKADALAAYRQARDRLGRLGRHPSDATRRLEASIVRDDPRLRVDEPIGLTSWSNASTRSRRPPPEPLLALAADRYSALSKDSQRVVEVLALLGGQLDDDLVAEVGGLDSVRLEQGLREASLSGMVTREDSGSAAIANADLALALTHLVPKATSTQLSARAADALLSRPDLASAVRGCECVLVHHEVATAWGDHVLRTLNRCVGADEIAAAEELSELALTTITEASALRVDLLTARVRILSMLGRAQQAQECWQDAVDTARTVGDPERLGLAVLAREWAWRSITAPPSDGRVFAEALALLEPEPSALRVRLLGGLLTENLGREGEPLAASAVEGLSADAMVLGDADSLCVALHLQHVALRGSPDLASRRDIGAELRLWSTDATDPMWLARAIVAEAYDAFVAGDLAAVALLLHDLDVVATRTRSSRLRWHLALIRTSLHREQGDWPEASSWAERAVMEGASAGIMDAPAAAILHQFLTAHHHADTAALLPPIERFLQERPDFALARACRSLALLDAGEVAASQQDLLETLARLDHRPVDEGHPVSIGLLGVVAARLRDVGACHRLAATAGPYAGQFLVFGQVSGTFGPADRVLALVHEALGNGDLARRHRQTALSLARASGATAWLRLMLPNGP